MINDSQTQDTKPGAKGRPLQKKTKTRSDGGWSAGVSAGMTEGNQDLRRKGVEKRARVVEGVRGGGGTRDAPSISHLLRLFFLPTAIYPPWSVYHLLCPICHHMKYCRCAAAIISTLRRPSDDDTSPLSPTEKHAFALTVALPKRLAPCCRREAREE